MQSQQKRVKWSRGETAEALEERTDTGVTQASVEFMENCIPDMYGNISRRPGLSVYNNYPLLSAPYTSGFKYDEYLQVIPFYITETDIILVGIHFSLPVEFIRLKDGLVLPITNSYSNGPLTSKPEGYTTLTYTYKPVSYTQQGNYLLIADAYNVWKISFSFDNVGVASPNIEIWKFTAGWYAPNGTQTKQVNDSVIAGLSFSGTPSGYVYTDNTTGQTTTYSDFDTGLTGTSGKESIETEIPVGSIVSFPNNGAYLRVEGYYLTGGNLVFPDVVFDNEIALNGQQTLPIAYQTGKVCVARTIAAPYFEYYNNGVLVETFPANAPYGYVAYNVNFYIRSSTSQTGEKFGVFTHSGMLTNFTWADAPQSDQKVYVFGSLLTPVADENATDKVVSVEYGYKSLQPEEFNSTGATYPHPTKLVFCEQRLWAGSWAFNMYDEYSLTVGSQIARYNDLKNNYNQENEPITLDILTQYKERILHLVDYNGLKIMTDAYEYAYVDGGAKKQSGNGSFEYCEPLVFDSLCLYVDSTGCQVKAMQYEFTNNVFDSTTINQFAPHNLVWYPWAMAQYEDKVNNTGKYLFLVNREDGQARVAVCNFVPGNQANIWNRWKFSTITLSVLYNNKTVSLIHSVVSTKNHPIFMVVLNKVDLSDLSSDQKAIIVPAYIDWEKDADTENTIYTANNVNYYQVALDGQNGNLITVPNATIAIYADGVFQFTTKTGTNGEITADLSQLTNVTAGLPINSKVISHPIDVGGKTKSIKKRIAKTVLSVHDTESGAITINGKTGYMNPQKDKINFYGVTGMKDEIKYTLTNNNGAMFHLESLLMNIEYGTLIS